MPAVDSVLGLLLNRPRIHVDDIVLVLLRDRFLEKRPSHFIRKTGRHLICELLVLVDGDVFEFKRVLTGCALRLSVLAVKRRLVHVLGKSVLRFKCGDFVLLALNSRADISEDTAYVFTDLFSNTGVR